MPRSQVNTGKENSWIQSIQNIADATNKACHLLSYRLFSRSHIHIDKNKYLYGLILLVSFILFFTFTFIMMNIFSSLLLLYKFFFVTKFSNIRSVTGTAQLLPMLSAMLVLPSYVKGKAT